ncbi:hypothetical protein NQ315_010068 [Exocentrus adspersus]|uniref:Translocon-associated protein subunit delta n=1 Tax=Exocentrus adspersus TaxID=1586481 RepID=A0AAV8WBB4_9CUCU|nr:hypothetical protein NQ315_010068 [Exocentrus adspersus]
MYKSVFTVTIFAVFSVVHCSSCLNIDVTSKSFTTQDATIVSNIGYISEFTVGCSSGDVTSLYAELEGNLVPVSVVGSSKYQVSWTEEAKTARSGEKVIRIFDEDGYNSYRKALRSGEDVSSVPALFSVAVNHPGAYSGPWLKSEFVATVVSLVIAYFALASRSKVVS